MPALSKDASERRLGAVLQQLSSHSQARRRRGSPPPPLPAAPAAADSAAEAQWQAALDLAVRERAATLAADLFDELREGTHDGIGITRASYGEGEDFAHSLLGATAASVEGLEVEVDAAGNTFMTLPGADRQLPAVVVGSHLDSVARGGNFDGAAGVVAGLVALCALRDAGIVPARDIRVMGIRGEEGEWFGVPFIGARSALGTLPLSDLDEARRVDSDMPLRHHMLESGCDLRAIEAGRGVSLPPAQQHAFIELHIEQGPQLEQKSLPLGVVTGIRGNTRLLGARCVGEYSHCGGVPRAQRHDAVVAAAELVAALDAIWDECEEANRDFAYTVGKFYTDEEHHQMSKIAGEVSFSLDMRSLDAHTLVEMEERVVELAAEIGERRGVTFQLGEFIRAEPGVLSDSIRQEMLEAAEALEIPFMELGSGASHDAQAFAVAGVPTAMLFIRNDHGSHNPAESMELDDLADASRVLARWLAEQQ